MERCRATRAMRSWERVLVFEQGQALATEQRLVVAVPTLPTQYLVSTCWDMGMVPLCRFNHTYFSQGHRIAMKLHAANYVQKCLVSPYMHLLCVGRRIPCVLVQCGCLHGCANTRHGPRRTTSSMLCCPSRRLQSKATVPTCRGRGAGQLAPMMAASLCIDATCLLDCSTSTANSLALDQHVCRLLGSGSQSQHCQVYSASANLGIRVPAPRRWPRPHYWRSSAAPCPDSMPRPMVDVNQERGCDTVAVYLFC